MFKLTDGLLVFWTDRWVCDASTPVAIVPTLLKVGQSVDKHIPACAMNI